MSAAERYATDDRPVRTAPSAPWPLRWEDAEVAEAGSGAERDGGFALPVGTVTFLLTDIEGSTRLWEADPDRMGVAVARHYEILDQAIADHGGVRPQEQGEGDSVVAAFSRARDAMGAALAAQHALTDEAWPTATAIRVRMAIHTGEAQLRDNANYFGQAIIRAARIRAVGYGGQTLVSNPTRDLLIDSLADATLADLGEHRLKDLGRPEHLWQLDAPGLPSDFGRLRSLDAQPNNLPVQLTTFVGRTDDIARVGSLLRETRLLTLTGSGGSGKTRLALQAAAEVADGRPGGVWFVELAALEDPALVVSAVAGALGVNEGSGVDPIDGIAQRLAGGPSLLVLDNCEHLLDACSRLVDQVLRAAPTVTVLATSRSLLEVPGELAWRVPPLSRPDSSTIDHRPRIETLRTYDAVRLFVDRARRVRPNFVLDDTNGAAVAAICVRLEGIPLALELAAARVRLLAPEQIAAGLDDNFRLLGAGARTALPRQQTLEASIEWSHALLDEDERTVLRRLSVFVGGFSLESAEVVVADDALDGYLVLDLLGRLVDRSLVVADTDGPRARFHLLETIRQFAGRRLDEVAETEAVRRRHLDHFRHVASELVPVDDLVTADPETGEREIGNLRAALAFAAFTSDDDPETWVVLVEALGALPSSTCPLSEQGRWVSEALERGIGDASRGRLLCQQARIQLISGDGLSAFLTGDQAVALGHQLGDPRVVGQAQCIVALIQGFVDPAGARARIEEVVSLDDRLSVAYAHVVLASAWLAQDRYLEALAALDRAEPLASALGSGFVWGHLHTTRAQVLARIGQFDACEAAARDGLVVTDTTGDQLVRGIALDMIASVLIMRTGSGVGVGEVDEAIEAQTRGEAGAITTMTRTLAGYRAMFAGEIEAAIAHYTVAIEAADRMGAPSLGIFPRLNLGQTLTSGGDLEGARHQAEAVRQIATDLDNELVSSCADILEAEIARAEGDFGEAERRAHPALEVQHRQGAVIHVIPALELLGVVNIEIGDPAGGTRLIAAARAGRAALDFGWQAAWKASAVDAALVAARASLGDEAFDSATRDGAALDLDAAVAYAQRARGERGRPSTGWASLTPTEHEVVTLACEGLTNPQIGERMFISTATVKTHLSHVFTKLDVTSRAQLATLAAQRSNSR